MGKPTGSPIPPPAGAGAGKPTGSPSLLLSAVLLGPVSCPIQRWLHIWPALYRTRVARPLSWDPVCRAGYRGRDESGDGNRTCRPTPRFPQLRTQRNFPLSQQDGAVSSIWERNQAQTKRGTSCPTSKRGWQRLHVLNHHPSRRRLTWQLSSAQELQDSGKVSVLQELLTAQ